MIPESKRQQYNLAATSISGVIVGSAIIYLAYRVGPERNVYPVTYLICIFGYILGWIVGIISSPMNRQDEEGIGKFSRIVGSFLSGYLISKFDKLFENIFDPANLFTGITGPRLLLFACCFCLTFVLVFYYRRYSRRVSPQ